MPMIDVVTSAAISKEAEQALKRGLGQAIALIPGKREETLMVRLSGGDTMCFAGDDTRSAAYVRVDVFGHAEEAVYQTFGSAVAELVSGTLGVERGRIYVTVREIPTWIVHKP